MCKGPNPGTLLLLGAPPWVAYMAHGWRNQEHEQKHSHAAYSAGKLVRKHWKLTLAIAIALAALKIWGVGDTPTQTKAETLQERQLNKVMELQDARTLRDMNPSSPQGSDLVRRLQQDLNRMQNQIPEDHGSE